MTCHELGKPKVMGQASQIYDPDHRVSGYRPRNPDKWDVAKCIAGQASLRENDEDKNLGKSTRLGFRNVTKPGDEGRAFGVPSIRSDIAKPDRESFANIKVSQMPIRGLSGHSRTRFDGVELRR